MRRASLLLATLVLATPAAAKPPTLDGLFPPGARRGAMADVTATGAFEHWPVRGWASEPGVIIEAAADKGKLKIIVADDVPPGLLWVRLVDDEGASALRPFFIGTAPEAIEKEPNDAPKEAQALDALPVTVNGRLAKAGDVDAFAVSLKRGQTLVAAVEANRRLGSPMDGVAQVVSPAGFVLTQNDDDQEHDPRLTFEAPADGTYLVRLFAFPATPDSAIRFAGGPSFVYRLTLTVSGFIDHAEPLAVRRGTKTTVEAVGPNILDAARRITVEPDPSADTIRVAHPLLANEAEVQVVPFATATEHDPNDPARPQAIEPPLAVTGRIAAPRDVDAYAVAAKAGETLGIRVDSRAFGLPMDPVVKVTDDAGTSLAESDDSSRSRDAELRFKAPRDGSYRVVVRDLNGQGGTRYAYLLTVAPPIADFGLSLKADQFTLTPGKALDIAVAVERLDDFDGVVTVALDSPPEGVKAEPVRSEPKGPSRQSVTLKVTAAEGAASGALRVVGATADGQRRFATATGPAAGGGGRRGQRQSPAPATTPWVWVTVAKPAKK